MNLEELNTSQVVLLTMLVSFVTSIATGIITASLMEEAPTDVTRVVQRVVERTVEKVTPSEQPAAAVVTERTVVVKESDLLAGAIAKNNSRVLNIATKNTDGTYTRVAIGVALDATHIATDAAILKDGVAYVLQMPTATEPVALSLSDSGGARGVALFTVSDEKAEVKLSTIETSDSQTALGKTVFAFPKSGNGKIITGIVDELLEGGYIGTTLDAASIVAGMPLFNVDGVAIGISTAVSRELGASVFVPIRAVVAQLSAPANTAEDTTATSTSDASAE